MNFDLEIAAWTDEDNLIGDSPNPSKCSTGNPIVETAMALMFHKVLKSLDQSILGRLWNGLMGLQIYPGLFNKKKCGNDQITRDDILAMAACSRFIDGIVHYQICTHGENNGWSFVNNESEGASWSARLKPDDIAVIKLIAGRSISIWESLYLYCSFSFSALTVSSTSGLRLKWMILKAIEGRDRILDIIGKFLTSRVNKKFGGIKGVNLSYYGNSEHPFVKYAPEE